MNNKGTCILSAFMCQIFLTRIQTEAFVYKKIKSKNKIKAKRRKQMMR